MPRSEKQKLKLLYLKQFLEEKTDLDHGVTNPQICQYLIDNGVNAERKSIYTDLDALEDFGLEIERGKDYRLTDRTFELKEVKMIIDSVASSKFLSESASETMVKKLGTLVSEHQRKDLRRQIRVMGRAKTMNNSALNAVDHIHSAISANTTIKFKYFHYNVKLEREYTRKGELYEVSPWALLYDNDNYYLLAFVDGDFRTFRVDRMASISQGTNERQGTEEFGKMDIAAYSKSTFSMFSGKEEKVDMIFQNRMMDVVVDKFGKDIWLTKLDDDHFSVSVNVAVSPQFYAWVFGLGNYVTITGPDHVVKGMKDMLEKVSKHYE